MFFKQALNAIFKNYSDGLVCLKNYLHLQDLGSKPAKLHTHEHEYERVAMEDLSSADYVKSDPMIYRMRHLTATMATGTIYGARQSIFSAGRVQSLCGLNKECINKDGFPNAALVAKYLREVAPSTEIKEQRINLFEDTILADDFYDNSISLIVCFLVKIQKMQMVQKTNKYPHLIKFSLSFCRQVAKVEEYDKQMTMLVNYIERGTHACGTSKGNLELYDLLERLLTWVEVHEGVEADDSMFYDYPCKVFHCYEYDDGHSKSGDNFGNVFGFKNNKYLVPTQTSMTNVSVTRRSCMVKSEIPATDSLIKNLRNYKYWLNCTNMSVKELKIIETVLQGNRRSTPFLIDQDIDLGIGEHEVAMIGRELDNARDTEYSEKELIYVLHKLISVHRWHEDALNAAKLLRPWYCQPGTETMESHWWLYINRALRLPTLGLKRAAIPCLLLGEPVCISVEAIKHYENFICSNDSVIIDSLLFNTFWYWGEFLMINNAKDGHELLRNCNFNLRDDLAPHERCLALVSAVSGEEIDACYYENFYNYIEGGIESHYGMFVNFGKIDVNHHTEYGYEMRENQVMLRHIVQPSCVSLIVGRAGSLLYGTPYYSTFHINPYVMRRRKGQLQRALNYYDLWAYGVVARWNGHDVHYHHPKHNGLHTIYAANNVSIAMPPVTPRELDEMVSYEVNKIVPRNHNWGDDFHLRLESEQMFSWSVHRLEILEQPDWNARVANVDMMYVSVPRGYISTSDIVKDTLVRLSTKYNFITPGFHVNRLVAGMTMNTNIDTSQLQHLEIEANSMQVEPPPPPISQ